MARTTMTQRRPHEDAMEPDPTPPKFVLMDESGWLQQLKVSPSVPGMLVFTPDNTVPEASPRKTMSLVLPVQSPAFGDHSHAPQPHRSDAPTPPPSSFIPRSPLSSPAADLPSISRPRSISPQRAFLPSSFRAKSALRLASPSRVPSRSVSPLSRPLSPVRMLSQRTSPTPTDNAHMGPATWHQQVSVAPAAAAAQHSPRQARVPTMSPRSAATTRSVPALLPLALSPPDVLQVTFQREALVPALGSPNISPPSQLGSLSPSSLPPNHAQNPSSSVHTHGSSSSEPPILSNRQYQPQGFMGNILVSPIVASVSPPLSAGLRLNMLRVRQHEPDNGVEKGNVRQLPPELGTPKRLENQSLLSSLSPARTRLPPPSQANTHQGIFTPISPRISSVTGAQVPVRLFGSSNALGTRSALSSRGEPGPQPPGLGRHHVNQAIENSGVVSEQELQTAGPRLDVEPYTRVRLTETGRIGSPRQTPGGLVTWHAVATDGPGQMRAAARDFRGVLQRPTQADTDQQHTLAESATLDDVTLDMRAAAAGQYSASSPYGPRQDLSSSRVNIQADLNSSLQRFSSMLEAENMRSQFLDSTQSSSPSPWTRTNRTEASRAHSPDGWS
jgi:hypothetical protein